MLDHICLFLPHLDDVFLFFFCVLWRKTALHLSFWMDSDLVLTGRKKWGTNLSVIILTSFPFCCFFTVLMAREPAAALLGAAGLQGSL